jgi:hypothetical protein
MNFNRKTGICTGFSFAFLTRRKIPAQPMMIFGSHMARPGGKLPVSPADHPAARKK